MAASALKRSMRVNPGAGIKNEAEKERSRAAKQLDTHMKVCAQAGRGGEAFLWMLQSSSSKSRTRTKSQAALLRDRVAFTVVCMAAAAATAVAGPAAQAVHMAHPAERLFPCFSLSPPTVRPPSCVHRSCLCR
jgi:hypothetical protein